jgi:hypothetical protein
MKTVNQNHITMSFMILVFAIATTYGSQQSFADPNSGRLIELGPETKKAACLAESVYWPDLDFNDVKANIVEPNAARKSEFVKVIRQIVNSNYLPTGLAMKTRFLKGWRGAGNENFVAQYEKQPYLIRIKNQTTTVVASRKWTSYWLAMVIQLKDKGICVNKSDLNAVLNFTDQFLSEKVNSKAQNYSGIQNVDGTNMVKPIFTQLDDGYYIVYPVQAFDPDIDSVIIWTDGHTVIINLQERRKEIIK